MIPTAANAPAPTPARDFDEATGRLVEVGPYKPPWLANPLALAPSGSLSGRFKAPDIARVLFFGLAVYGGLVAAAQACAALNIPYMLSPSGCIVAAVSMSLCLLGNAYSNDNTPRS